MGAVSYSTAAFGKTMDEAYRAACNEARDYNGHQEGYSGDIQCSNGCVLFELPKGVSLKSFDRLVALFVDRGYDDKPPTKAMLKHKAFHLARRYSERIEDKRGVAAAIKLPAKAKADFGKKGCRGNVYRFEGLAAC